MSYVIRYTCCECLEQFDTAEQASSHVTSTENPIVPLPNPHRVYPIHTYIEDGPTDS